MGISGGVKVELGLACVAAGQFLEGEGKDRLPGFLMFLNCQSTGGLEIRDWLKSKLAVTGSHQSKFSCNCKLHENTQVKQGIIASLILFNAILLIAHFEKNYELIQERHTGN